MGHSSIFDIFDYFILQLFDIRIYLSIVQSLINHCNNSQDIKTDTSKDISKSIFAISRHFIHLLVSQWELYFVLSRDFALTAQRETIL